MGMVLTACFWSPTFALQASEGKLVACHKAQLRVARCGLRGEKRTNLQSTI